MKGSNPAYFIAGIIEGILCSAKMDARVTAHLIDETESGTDTSTIYVVKFSAETAAREKKRA